MNRIIMKRTLFACLLVAVMACAVLAQDQTRRGKSEAGRIVTVTRLVAMFSDLESQWLKAVQQKDEGTLNRLLAQDLRVWMPTPPGDPIPREDLLKQALSQRLESFAIRQMAVRSLHDDTALVSFVLHETVEQAGKPVTSDYFVIDVWQKVDSNWQVADRYFSEVASSPAQTSVKPSGKN
jgi:ketosteroid isomerase-like protein